MDPIALAVLLAVLTSGVARGFLVRWLVRKGSRRSLAVGCALVPVVLFLALLPLAVDKAWLKNPLVVYVLGTWCLLVGGSILNALLLSER